MAKMLPPLRGDEDPAAVGKAARWMAALCYLNILILIPACTRWRKEEFVRFHLNQGTVVLMFSAVTGAVALLPGWAEAGLWLTLLVEALSLAGLINALRRRKTPLPLLGKIAENLHPF